MASLVMKEQLNHFEIKKMIRKECQDLLAWWKLHEQHFPYGWLQGRVIHVFHHNVIFCKVSCIYMLLTCHKINNIPNLWLYLNFELEWKDIFIKNVCIKYIIMNFWSWKVWISFLSSLLYISTFIYGFYLGYFIRIQHMTY
jgi:hypothetical protein